MTASDVKDATIQRLTEANTALVKQRDDAERECARLRNLVANPSEQRGEDSILMEAEKLIHGQRSKDYGHPKMNFQRIADLWNSYIRYSVNEELTPTDTAVMMILLKVARLQQNPTNRDSVVDIAGYAGTIERLWEKD